MLDTNICIYLINNKLPELAQKITDIPKDSICISVITQAELEFGVYKSQNPAKNAHALVRFLSAIGVIDFGTKAAAAYGEIRANLERKGTAIGNMDMLIAAHARSLGLTVVTNNTKEFARVEGLEIENWVSEQ